MANVTINGITSTAQDIQDNDLFIIWDLDANSNNGGTSQVSSTAIKSYVTEGLASTAAVEDMISSAVGSISESMITTSQVSNIAESVLSESTTINTNTNDIELLANWIRAFYTATADNEGTVTIPSTADNDASWVSYLFPEEEEE